MDLLEIFHFPVNLFKMFGLWPWQNPAKYKRLTILLLFLIMLISMPTLFIFSLLESKNIKAFLHNFGLVTGCFALLAKVFNLLLKINKIQHLLVTVKDLLQHDDWLDGDCQNLNRKVTGIRKIFRYRFSFTMTSATLNFVVAIFTRKLIYTLPGFITKDNNFVFQAVNSYFYFYNLTVTPTSVILDYLPVFFMAFAIGFYQELQLLFTAINAKVDQQQLKKFIIIEIKIRNFVDEILDCFSTILIIQAGLSTIIICSLSFTLTLVSFVNL